MERAIAECQKRLQARVQAREKAVSKARESTDINNQDMLQDVRH
jgi:hypothetical protein